MYSIDYISAEQYLCHEYIFFKIPIGLNVRRVYRPIILPIWIIDYKLFYIIHNKQLFSYVAYRMYHTLCESQHRFFVTKMTRLSMVMRTINSPNNSALIVWNINEISVRILINIPMSRHVVATRIHPQISVT